MKIAIILSITLLLLALPASSISAHMPTPEATLRADVVSTCPDIVTRAWASLDEACVDGVRNTACYGHILLDATPQTYVTDFQFETAGDRANVADLQTLQLSSMDIIDGSWGVAMLTVQANLPASDPTQNVALLMFGDVQIEQPNPMMPVVDVYADAGGYNANIRQLPLPTAPVIGSIPAGSMTTATGRLADNSWIRVQVPNTAQTGWVSASIVSFLSQDELDTLEVVAPAEKYYGPMQAFYLESAPDDRACPEAPNSGILIQTPEGVAEVTLLINEVDISLGSTVYFQAQAGGELRVSVIEGHADVTANGIVSRAVAGTEVRVPLGENGAAAGSPSLPKPYDLDNLQGLPVDHLPAPVVVEAPLSQPAIDTLIITPTSDDVGGSGGGDVDAHGGGSGGGSGHVGDDDDDVGGGGGGDVGDDDAGGGGGGDDTGDDDTGDDDAEEKITICHKGKNTITISISAWPAHQAHGDTLGPCPGD